MFKNIIINSITLLKLKEVNLRLRLEKTIFNSSEYLAVLKLELVPFFQ